MSKIGSYSRKSCRQNPIFRSFLLKKIFQKKIFCSKKIKKSKLTNFRFQLDRKLGFRVRGKTPKLRKQVELGHRDVSTCLREWRLGNPRWVGNPIWEGNPRWLGNPCSLLGPPLEPTPLYKHHLRSWFSTPGGLAQAPILSCCNMHVVCMLQYESYGFTCGWNHMAECRSWLYNW